MRRALSGGHSSHLMSAFVCGLDVHSESTYATILGPDGGVVAQKRVPNELVPEFLKPFGVERVGLEASTVHLRYDTPVTRAYHRIAERRGKQAGKVAAARMLLLYCRSVMKNRRPYFNPVHSQA